MARHEDPHAYDEDLQSEAVSPNRPPQFNASTCGYRCGWGCCEPVGGDEDGGGYGSDGTPTLIGSDDGEIPDEFDALPLVAPELQQDITDDPVPVVVDDIEDNILLNLPIPTQVEVFSPEQSDGDYQESADSVENQVASEVHSRTPSDRRSIGSASPCGWDAGMDLQVQLMGAWNDMDKTGRVLPGHFCVTPLRLSPYYEHCRGNPASHLITQDYSMLLEIGAEEPRMRMFSHGFTLQPDEWSFAHGSTSAD